MKASVKTVVVVAFLGGVAWICASSMRRGAQSALAPEQEGNVPDAAADVVNVDIDFTRMSPTMRMTEAYRLSANPTEFVGKTLRLSGTFLTRVDKKDGKRYFGCLMGDPGGCACCSPGGVLEFVPKDSYVWPEGFPPVESQITVTGNIKMFEVGSPEQSFTIPRLVDADISRPR